MCQKASFPSFGGQLQVWGPSTVAFGMEESLLSQIMVGEETDQKKLVLHGPGGSREPGAPL